jgi:putative heme-binding domain-containing protein
MQSMAQEAKTNFFLPQNPVAAAYVLGRLSNQELIAAPRSEFVYSAMLQRGGLERKYRIEAVQGLATIRHTDQPTELLKALSELDKKGEGNRESLRDLGQILLEWKSAELFAKREVLVHLATESKLAMTRQIGFAAIIMVDGSIVDAWKQGESSSLLPDLLLGVPGIRDAQLRASAYPKIEPLVHREDAPELRRAAISAIVSIRGHEAETFKTLSELVRAGIERPTAIAALQRIPSKMWPKESIEPLVNALTESLQNVPTSERTGPDFTSALQFATDLASFLPEDKSRNLGKTLRGLGPTIIVLRAVYEQLRYDKQTIVVEAGKPVAIVLENEDAMPHNLAILMPGALEEIGTATEKMTGEPDAEGRLYIPASPKVLHATKLVAPGQKIQLAFTAPSEPGEFPYVCTFPGHWRRMVGTMVVVKDVEQYLASHAETQQVKITEWKVEELAPELSKVGYGRNLENGKSLFTQLACVQCHKLGKLGYAFGPDLTGVLGRYKNDRASVLLQILEPSKIIEERYRNYNFEIKNSEPVIGMILKEDAQTISIQTGPADSLIQTINKSEIQKREPQPSSPMPVGLLNALSREQILDLLAYVESEGNIETHAHQHQ